MLSGAISATSADPSKLLARAADLVRTLIEARDAKELGRTMRRLERIDLVIIDEVGFVPFDRQGGELLFNVLAARDGRRSVLITTNLAFAEWPRVFGGDEKLTTALLDRLAEHATVITTKGKSYRMRKRGADTQAQASASEAIPANSTSTHQKEAAPDHPSANSSTTHQKQARSK